MAKETIKRFSVLGLPPQLDLGSRAAPLDSVIKTVPQPIKPAAINQASKPINVPGHASPSLAIPTPQPGGEARRRACLRQASDTALDASGAAATEPSKFVSAAPLAIEDLQALGSWALRQTVLPLPPKPAGFPAAATKARTTKAAPRPREADTDAAWRYRFRQKWRREQLRALIDGPDRSPDEDVNRSGCGSFDYPEQDDMMFELDDVPLPSMPQPTMAAAEDVAAAGTDAAAAAAAAAAAVPAMAPAAALVAARTTSQAAQPHAAEGLHVPPAAPALRKVVPVAPPPQPAQQQQLQDPAARQPRPAQRTGEVLQGAFPGSTIRKVVMRGRGARGSAEKSKVVAVPERRWATPLGWTSPARASQAA